MNLLKAAATVSGMTLASRLTGLARDILIARAFGAGSLTDAFWVAFRIPNLLRRLFAEGAFSQAFVPILGEVKAREPLPRTKEVLDRVASLLTVALMAVTLVGILGAPWVVLAMGSGLSGDGQAFDAAVLMTRVMFPYIVCMSLVAFAAGVLNTWRRFVVPAFTPVLLNLSMIGASLWLAPYMAQPILALAIGVMIGGLAQLAVQALALRRLCLWPRFTWRLGEVWADPVVRRIVRQMLPATLGVSVAQLSLLINTNIATWLTPGSVTWLSFADRLMEFPSAMLGVALGTVLLPSLSRAHASAQPGDYSALLDWGLRLTLLLGLPACVGMALLSEGLVSTLFHYGAFGAADVAQTRLAVLAYSVGLTGLLCVKVLAPGFYARQDIRTPVRIALYVLVATQCMNLVFVPRLGHAGLALSIGLAACGNAAALLYGLRRKGMYQPAGGWRVFLLKLATALAAMGGALWLVQDRVPWLALQAQPLQRAGWLLLLVGGAVVVYFVVLAALGFRPRDFKRREVRPVS